MTSTGRVRIDFSFCKFKNESYQVEPVARAGRVTRTFMKSQGVKVPKSSSSLLKRRLDIAEIVRKHGEIKVDDLSAQLGVSGVTIRNDLNYLEQQGYLKRSFGGAIYTAQPEGLLPVSEPRPLSPVNSRVELELARQCARLVKDRDTLFLGQGDLLRKTLPFLADHKSLRVIVNDLSHAWIADDFIDGDVVVAGGVFKREAQALSGELVLHTLRQFDITCSLLVVDSINPEGELCVQGEALADIYRAVIAQSERCIVVVARRSAAEHGGFEVGSLDDISALVAPQIVVADFHAQMSARGLQNNYTNNECLTYINA